MVKSTHLGIPGRYGSSIMMKYISSVLLIVALSLLATLQILSDSPTPKTFVILSSLKSMSGQAECRFCY
jgi:hypothetical protein